MAAVSAAAADGGSGGQPQLLVCCTCTAPHSVSSCSNTPTCGYAIALGAALNCKMRFLSRGRVCRR